MQRDVDLTTTVRAPFDRTQAVLVDDPRLVLAEDRGDLGDGDGAALRSTIGVTIGVGSTLLQQVVVEVGEVGCSDEEVRVPLRWYTAGWERLLPAFDGTLSACDAGNGSRLYLRGSYRVPLGPLGGFGDGIVGRRVARHSLTAFLEKVAIRLDQAAGQPHDDALAPPTPYVVEVREVGSDNFVG